MIPILNCYAFGFDNRNAVLIVLEGIMSKLSKAAEKLLKEIIDHRYDNGNCDVQYWKVKFDELSMSEDIIMRSSFKELREANMISVLWGDDYPYQLFLLPKGIEYFESQAHLNDNKNVQTFTNNFYAPVSGIQIQQGTNNSSQEMTNYCMPDAEKLSELIALITRYDKILDQEFGDLASTLRDCCNELKVAIANNESSTKKWKILNVIKDISTNAIGGVISAAILNLINSI